jgi:hypothetical protein
MESHSGITLKEESSMLIRRFRSRKALSNVTEYVILVAVVAGAAIAMQQYVKSRLQGAVKTGTDDFEYSAKNIPGNVAYTVTFEPNRVTASDASTALNMQSATQGDVTVDSASQIDATK